MHIMEGSSDDTDAVKAVIEAVEDWPEDTNRQPDMIFVFHSTAQSPDIVAACLAERFPDALIAGCTTAGEWRTKQHQNGTLVLLGISTDSIRWGVSVLDRFNCPPAKAVQAVCTDLTQQLGIEWSDLHPDDYFCLSFFDGMSKQEETFIAAMSSELGNIPLLGGSAGDDQQFEKTYVIANGKAYENAAVFVLAETKIPFHTLKHQHFIPGEATVVITRANVAERVVYHLDGIPAADRYAQLLGLKLEELEPQVFSKYPLIYSYGGECYVRSVQQIGKDGSLVFYCAIEEGMVLNLCEHQDMLDEFDKAMKKLVQNTGKVRLLFVCNCILRDVEARGANLTQLLVTKANKVADNIIGFDTYGEQWQGLHINQTMVALALGCK